MKKNILLFSAILIIAVFLSLAFSVYAESSLADEVYERVVETVDGFFYLLLAALILLVLVTIALITVIFLAVYLHSLKKKEHVLINASDKEGEV